MSHFHSFLSLLGIVLVSSTLSCGGPAPKPTGRSDRPVGVGMGNDVAQGPNSGQASIKAYRAEKRKGTEFPVYWVHLKDQIKLLTHGTNAERPSEYADLWLVKELTATFAELAKAPYRVEKIAHIGIYNYRRIAGSKSLSRHSYALAIDISTFILADGTKITIEDDWKSGAHKGLLRQIRDLFCQRFDVVLSPDYNRNHYNHLHIDLNPARRGQRESAVPAWADLEVKPDSLLFAPMADEFSLSEGLIAEEAEGHSLLALGNDRTCK